MMDDGSRIDGRSAAASSGADRSDLAREKAFRRARRHTLLVKVMRIGLPALATVALAGYGLVVLGALSLQSVGVKLGEIRVTSEDLKMKNPSYFGVGADGSRYEVRAREAAVDLAQTGPIRLTGIDGDLFQTNGVVTRLKATQGTLENASGRLELFDGVDIEGTDGLKARLRSAEILTKENRISSKEPVIAAMPAGTVRGDSLVLMTKQKTGVVAGNVQLQLVQPEGTQQRSTGFGGDPRQPVVINADRMDFDDTARRVVFKDNIRAQQGATTLTTTSMVVEYEGRAEAPGAAAAGAQPPQSAQISKITARSGVMIVSGADRRVRSDAVDFDMKADTVLFTGPAVEVTQGKNRMLGRRLAIDRKQGLTRLDAPAAPGLPAGRIQTTFVQAEPEGQPKPARPAQGAADASALGSFRADSGAPMDIEAVSLEVNDTQKQAIYRGGVRAQQGDMLIQSEELIATYAGDTGLMSGAEPPPPPAPTARGAPRPAAAGGAQLTRVETRARVLLTSKDGQEATGDWAIFDVKANTAVIGGNVTIKRGRDVINGQRLRIDMATGQFNFETPQGDGPVIAAPFRVMPGANDPPKQKSAPGPGGLPDVIQRQPLPAQPAPNSTCPPGRQCILLYPEDAKKTVEKARPKNDGWQPSASPSPVYKAPGQP